MKLIEALKNLKTVEKRIEKNCSQIANYAAAVSIESLPFETPEKQEAEVAKLVQANLDLMQEHLRLKCAIEITNLNTKVVIGSREHSISELIAIRRTIGKFMPMTYGALNPSLALQRLQQAFNRNGGVDAQNPPRVIVFYKEEDKNAKLKDWDEFFTSIDGKLEVVNAETELLNY